MFLRTLKLKININNSFLSLNNNLKSSLHTIVLIRHGESQQNTGEVNPQTYGDYKIELSEKGIKQARRAGKILCSMREEPSIENDFQQETIFDNCLYYVSPYIRTKQTLNYILESARNENVIKDYSKNKQLLDKYEKKFKDGWEFSDVRDKILSEGRDVRDIQYTDLPSEWLTKNLYEYSKYKDLTIYEDVRLREVEFGYSNVNDQQINRLTHGWFYYRFKYGESPADCYDRVSAFLESMMRHCERLKTPKVMIVSHGLAIRCFIMKFLRLEVNQFNILKNPDNADIIVLSRKDKLDSYHPDYEKYDIPEKKRKFLFHTKNFSCRGLSLY